MTDYTEHYRPPASSTPGGAGQGMRYLYSLTFVKEHPEYLSNVFLATLLQFIPIVGPIALYGYVYEIVAAVIKGEQYPKFEFDRFMPYLKSGVWTFVVGFIGVFVFFIFFALVSLVVGGVAAGFGMAIGPEEDGSVMAIVQVAVMFIGLPVGGVLAGLVMRPMTLRAVLMNDLGAAFDFGFVRQYVALTWKEQLLSSAFLLLVMPFALLIGMLACFVGMYFTLTWIWFSIAHLEAQIYRLFVARGGKAIEIKIPLPV